MCTPIRTVKGSPGLYRFGPRGYLSPLDLCAQLNDPRREGDPIERGRNELTQPISGDQGTVPGASGKGGDPLVQPMSGDEGVLPEAPRGDGGDPPSTPHQQVESSEEDSSEEESSEEDPSPQKAAAQTASMADAAKGMAGESSSEESSSEESGSEESGSEETDSEDEAPPAQPPAVAPAPASRPVAFRLDDAFDTAQVSLLGHASEPSIGQARPAHIMVDQARSF